MHRSCELKIGILQLKLAPKYDYHLTINGITTNFGHWLTINKDMETIVAPVSIEKSPEARGRSGLLTYKHKKIDLLLKEATYIYIHTKPQPMNLFFSQCKQSNLINLHHSLLDNHNNFFFFFE